MVYFCRKCTTDVRTSVLRFLYEIQLWSFFIISQVKWLKFQAHCKSSRRSCHLKPLTLLYVLHPITANFVEAHQLAYNAGIMPTNICKRRYASRKVLRLNSNQNNFMVQIIVFFDEARKAVICKTSNEAVLD